MPRLGKIQALLSVVDYVGASGSTLMPGGSTLMPGGSTLVPVGVR